MDRDRLVAPYDHVAATYERRVLAELGGKPRDRELLRRFAAAVGDPVLEVGCGPGQIGAFVRGQGRVVVGVDLSRRMASRAGRRLDAAPIADMGGLPIATASVGGVVAFYSLIHLARAELTPVVADLRRVLRPGGR